MGAPPRLNAALPDPVEQVRPAARSSLVALPHARARRWLQRSLVHRAGVFTALLASSCVLASCKDDPKPPPPSTSPHAPLTPRGPDRLTEGKLLEGPEVVFGFRVPKKMTIRRRTRELVRIGGYVKFDDLTDYVKQRVVVQHAELMGTKLVFPNAVIRGNQGHVFELTQFEQNGVTFLDIIDKTKAPAVKGLTETQRWERAGFKPNGQLIDPNKME